MDLSARLKTVFAGGSEKSPPPSRTAKPMVLVVEDDDALRWMLVRALEGSYNVIEAQDGRAALDLITKVRPPDAIICDMMMPRVDGVSFVRALKRIPRLMSVPVLFLTARDSTIARLEGINAGVRHYVTKPFKIADVLAKVEKMISDPVSEVRHPAVIP
jgi:DNA-binding response OmpR family regulator